VTPSLAYLLELPRYATSGSSAIKPGLDRIERLLAGLSNPERTFRSVLVAGTNGKGSVASMVSACLTAAGMRTGLHTSPHLLHVGERMRIDGQPADEDWLSDTLRLHAALFQEISPSFFEAVFALSCLYFSEKEVDMAVVEVGLGGRLDASNILSAEVSVITSIALDHTHILGGSLSEIAREKAGIVKEGRPVVCGALDRDSLRVITDIAASREAPLHDASKQVRVQTDASGRTSLRSDMNDLASLRLDLVGDHQRANSAVALRTLELVAPDLTPDSIRVGLESTSRLSGIRGRADIIARDPLIMVDVAHNVEAIESALRTFFAERARYNAGGIDKSETVDVILGLLADKDVEEIATVLVRYPVRVLPVEIDVERGLDASSLADILRGKGVSVLENPGSAWKAVSAARKSETDCIVLGSHHVAAEILRLSTGQSAH